MRKRLTTHIGPNLSIDSTGTQQELDKKMTGTWQEDGGCGVVGFCVYCLIEAR